MLGESRRVEHDEVIVARFHGIEELEGILGVCLVTAVAGKVQLYILSREFHGFLRRVD